MKKILAILLGSLMILVACNNFFIDANNVEVGEIIELGDWYWIVLAVDDDKALIINQQIIDWQPINVDDPSASWQDSNLREWLNNDFYNSFTIDEQARIIGVSASRNDKIFLLSVMEVITFWGGDNQIQIGIDMGYFSGTIGISY